MLKYGEGGVVRWCFIVRLSKVGFEDPFSRFINAQLIKLEEITIELPDKLSDNDLEVMFSIWSRKNGGITKMFAQDVKICSF